MGIEKSALKLVPPVEGAFAKATEKRSARVVAVTSGKGGVGKTNVAANLGIALARQGKKVCVLDADLGMANINILLGLYPEYTIEDLFSKNRDIEELITRGPEGIDIIPGASSLGRMSGITEKRHLTLVRAAEKLEQLYDYILIDTSAGISETVFTFIASAHESVVIISPEPTSLTDAYSLLKVLKGKGIQKGLYALVNMVLSYEDSVKIFNRFNSTTKKFLGTELKYLGYIMTDQIIVASVIQQKPVMILNPESTPGHCFTSIAGKFQTDFKFFENTRFSENLHRVTALKGEGKERVAGEKSAVKLKEGAFTTPEDVKKGYGKSFGKGEDPGTVIVRLIEEGGLSLDKASEYVRKIEEACINRFRKSPVDIKNSLYSSLDLSGFSESRIREFALMLEALYAKRYQKQLFDLEDILIRLIEEGEGSEERLKQMIGNLRNRYRTSFKKSELSVEEFLADYLNADDLTKDDFENIAGIIQSACMEKFGKSFRLITEDMHEEVLEAFRSIKERDVTINTLLQQVTRQSQSRATLSQTLNEKLSDSGFE